MKLFTIATAASVATASATVLTEVSLPTEFHKIAAKVNMMEDVTWVAEAPTRFNTTEDVAQLCGTWLKGSERYLDHRLPELVTEVADEDVPSDFDARTNWPKCATIAKVRDQSSCGSCWAFGSTEAFEDAHCVATGKSIEFSAQDTTACCNFFAGCFSMGCNGGQPSAALSWMSRRGVVTGGDYFDIGSGSSCLPYSLKPCAHHVPATSKYGKCPTEEYSTPKCVSSCSESSYTTSYSDDKTKGGSAHSVSGVSNIQKAIMTSGPVAAAFSVYSDFPTYKSGVYKHKTGSMLGGHAIELVGWGVENGEDYWLVKNSWNEMWGDGGFFKIARGNDECGIESQVSAITF